jgi:hypothetical protein
MSGDSSGSEDEFRDTQSQPMTGDACNANKIYVANKLAALWCLILNLFPQHTGLLHINDKSIPKFLLT